MKVSEFLSKIRVRFKLVAAAFSIILLLMLPAPLSGLAQGK